VIKFVPFKSGENEKFLFLQLPISLIKDNMFKTLSSDAKILYSLLLNRTSLSAKNGWVDENDNIYIIYTIEQIMEDLNCGNQKAIKAMKELKEIGLVKSVRLGLGKPNIIYVMNFSVVETPEKPDNTQKCENHISGSVKITSQEIPDSHFRKCENHTVDRLIFNNIDHSDIESSQSQRQTSASEEKNDMTLTMTPDALNNENIKLENKRTSAQTAEAPKYNMSVYNTHEQMIKDNIEYEHYAKHNRADLEMIDGLVQIMLDVILTEDPPTVKIGKETKSREIVKSVYLKLNSQHMDHIIEQYKAQHHKITHKTAYLRTMLYTVGQEIDAHYTNQVRADGVVW